LNKVELFIPKCWLRSSNRCENVRRLHRCHTRLYSSFFFFTHKGLQICAL